MDFYLNSYFRICINFSMIDLEFWIISIGINNKKFLTLVTLKYKLLTTEIQNAIYVKIKTMMKIIKIIKNKEFSVSNSSLIPFKNLDPIKSNIG